MHARQQIAVIIAMFLLGTPAAESQTITPAGLMKIYQEGLQAEARKDYATYEKRMLAFLQVEPGHPVIVRNAARAAAITGNVDLAVARLEQVVECGADLKIGEDENFRSLKDDPRFKKLVTRVELLRRPIGVVELVHRLDFGNFLPEGIAYDPVTGDLYLGSVNGRKVVRIQKDGTAGDFTASGAAGMLGTLGLRVDAERRHLWAVSTIMAGMEGYTEETDGTAALHCYDLETGKLLQKFMVRNDEARHNFNDVVVTGAGDVYLTDALAGMIYTVRRDRGELRSYTTPGSIVSPNGIVLAANDTRLYVAQNPIGVVSINLLTDKVTMVGHPADVTVVGIDGLYLYENSLIGVQNLYGMMRVSRFFLNEAGDQIVSAKIIASHDSRFEDPTTGAIVGESLVFVGNSQLPKVRRDGSMPTREYFDPTYILKVSLAK